MKKLITIILSIVFLLSCTASGYAKQPVATALSWWLEEQGKRDGATICTRNNVLTKWVVQGVPCPTESEIDTICDDYQDYLDQEEIDKQAKKDVLKSKMKIDEDDLKTLKEIINGKL